MKIVTIFLKFSFFCVLASVHAELLIVKQTAAGFEPIPEEESVRAGEVISPILLKYQWPMVIASDLTEVEQNELLSPGGEPYKEAKFIEAKIRANGAVFENYRVVFIPTCLYELFVIWFYFENMLYYTPIHRAAARRMLSIDLLDFFADKQSKYIVKREINKLYQQTNEDFSFSWHGYGSSAWLCVNNALVDYLFISYPDLKTDEDLGADIKLMSFDGSLLTTLVDDLSLFESLQRCEIDNPHAFKTSYGVESDDFVNLLNDLKTEVGKIIVEKVIGLEYEADTLNKALLLRGTGYESFKVGIGAFPKKCETERLAGTTLYTEYGSNLLYSISFGNSLFAGIVHDPGASVYTYLVSAAKHGIVKDMAIGYALLIDKKAYYQHRLGRLFFIPALGTLPALYSRSWFFHPRTTVATACGNKTDLSVCGVLSRCFTDISGNIIITRDPLLHAELFSKFIADNGRVIQVDPTGRYASSQAEFAEKVIGSQRKAANFYKASRVVKPRLKKLAENLRRGIQADKESDDA